MCAISNSKCVGAKFIFNKYKNHFIILDNAGKIASVLLFLTKSKCTSCPAYFFIN